MLTPGNGQLDGGVPFISDADLQAALDKAGVSEETATAALEANQRHGSTGFAPPWSCSPWSRCWRCSPRGGSPQRNQDRPHCPSA